jgi:hypothetical protein
MMDDEERERGKLLPCSFGLSATSQQYFSLRTNQPRTTSQQYSSLRTNQPPANRTGHTPHPQALKLLRILSSWVGFSLPRFRKGKVGK